MINNLPKSFGFEHLHRHTDVGSLLDGFGTVEEYAERSRQINQQYLCITDHGMMSAVPRQIKAAEKYKLNSIYGIELYVNPMQFECNSKEEVSKFVEQLSPDDKQKFSKAYHLLAIAHSDVGYSNLVQLSSWGWTKGYYRKPRVNHEQLMKHKEGITFTSCCYIGEIGQAFDRGGKDEASDMLEKYMAMFGKHFYLEMMLLDFKKQKPYDKWLVEASQKYHLPTIITQDCHYCNKEDSKYQQYMLMVRTKNTLKDIENAIQNKEDIEDKFFELQDKNLWMKSEEEINEKWVSDYTEIIPKEIFEEAKLNTVKICENAKNVKIDKSLKLPKVEDSDEKFREALAKGFKWRCLSGKVYMDRLKEEYDLICRKGFSSYFLIQKLMTDEARRVAPELLGWDVGRYAVGPGRGSAGGSLACYCMGITDIDPVKHDLLFSRFLSESRGGNHLKTRFTQLPEELLSQD